MSSLYLTSRHTVSVEPQFVALKQDLADESPSHWLIRYNAVPEGRCRWMTSHYPTPRPQKQIVFSRLPGCFPFPSLHLIPPSISRCTLLTDLLFRKSPPPPPQHHFSSSTTTPSSSFPISFIRFFLSPSISSLLFIIFPSSLHSPNSRG